MFKFCHTLINGRNSKRTLAASVLVLASALSAKASIITLTFDELNGNGQEAVQNFYNGGYGSLGTGPGQNYGITFSNNAITCREAPSGFCNTAASPSDPNILFFLSGSADTMNVANGFTNGFSFYYSTIHDTGFVNVWSGLDASGTLLATLTLPTTPSSGGSECLGTSFCPYVPFGISFQGTAHSVDFGGVADQVAFDNVTLGTVLPTPGPVIGAGMPALLGLLGIGFVFGRQRKLAA